MQISDAQKDAARAAAVEDHIIRHAADAIWQLKPQELASCYQHQKSAIRVVLERALDHLANPTIEHEKMMMQIPAEEEARAVAVRDHIVRHAADALRLLKPAELVICYQQHPAIREVIDLAIEDIAYTLREHKVQLDTWRAAQAIQGVLDAR